MENRSVCKIRDAEPGAFLSVLGRSYVLTGRELDFPPLVTKESARSAHRRLSRAQLRRARAVNSKIAIEFPLTNALMVLPPFFAFYIDIIFGVRISQGLAEHLIMLETVDRLGQCGRRK